MGKTKKPLRSAHDNLNVSLKENPNEINNVCLPNKKKKKKDKNDDSYTSDQLLSEIDENQMIDDFVDFLPDRVPELKRKKKGIL